MSAPVSVSELLYDLRVVIDDSFGPMEVAGEVSNWKRHTSGHCYFTLKDADAQIRCVMWRSDAERLTFQPSDGMQLHVEARPDVYPRRGELQLQVTGARPAGEGALRAAFERLKAELDAEGLFDPARKRPLPRFPERIALVTSGTSAALQDMLSILARRFPATCALVCPVRVQGLGAAEEIAEAIAAFSGLDADDPLRPDVLVVGRGGGSAEDLWAFNEEVLARAIAGCPIPVVSAVGHETDFSIADFVADARAATPSMAAELVVPDRLDVSATVRGLALRMRERLDERVRTGRQAVSAAVRSRGLARPVYRLGDARRRCDDLSTRLARALPARIERARSGVETLEHRLLILDPTRPLRMGYARVEHGGHRVASSTALPADADVVLHFHDGSRRARVLDAAPEGN